MGDLTLSYFSVFLFIPLSFWLSYKGIRQEVSLSGLRKFIMHLDDAHLKYVCSLSLSH